MYKKRYNIFSLSNRILEAAPKDPLVYLGVISGILLLAVSFFPLFKPSSDAKGGFSVLASASQTSPARDSGLFLDRAVSSRAESPKLIFVESASLRAVSPLGVVTPQVLGALVGDSELPGSGRVVMDYDVEEGDSLNLLAEKFGVSLDSLFWANNLNKKSVIKIGQKLLIPPVSGVIHYVKAGDTVSEIAKKYKARSEEIIFFNELSSEADVFVGDVVVVPGGIMPKIQPAPSPLSPLASSYFICPIGKPCNITQGLHFNNAVDFSNGQCGDPIFAAAGGKVQKVKLTTSRSASALGGAGNHLTILHPNGVVTSYGHLLSSLVDVGDEVYQGQIIALMGGKPGTPGAGKTTGCHVHFGVYGARNPFAK